MKNVKYLFILVTFFATQKIQSAVAAASTDSLASAGQVCICYDGSTAIPEKFFPLFTKLEDGVVSTPIDFTQRPERILRAVSVGHVKLLPAFFSAPTSLIGNIFGEESPLPYEFDIAIFYAALRSLGYKNESDDICKIILSSESFSGYDKKKIKTERFVEKTLGYGIEKSSGHVPYYCNKMRDLQNELDRIVFIRNSEGTLNRSYEDPHFGIIKLADFPEELKQFLLKREKEFPKNKGQASLQDLFKAD